jgi:hypothetical protein
MAPYCVKHSHSWLYIWPPGDYAPPGYGGEVDHFPFTGDFRSLVVEGTFIEEAVEEERAKEFSLIIKSGDELHSYWLNLHAYCQNCTFIGKVKPCFNLTKRAGKAFVFCDR